MLHKLDSVFVVHLLEEKLVEFKKLVTLNVLDLLGTADMSHLGNSVRELKVDKGVDSIEKAFRLNILGLVGSPWVLCNC